MRRSRKKEAKVVADADIDLLRKIHSKGHTPANMDLLIAGGIPDNARDLVAAYFGNHRSRGNTRREFPTLSPLEKQLFYHFSAPWMINSENPEDSSAEIILSYVAPRDESEDAYTMRILSSILGSGEHSRLFQRLREKEGLSYRVGTGYSSDYGAGHFRVRAMVPVSKLERAKEVILDEVHKMSFVPVSDESLLIEKKRIIYGLAKNFEKNEGHVYAMQLLLDRQTTIPELIEGYNRVTQEDIMRVAQEYLKSPEEGKYLLSIADPLKKE